MKTPQKKITRFSLQNSISGHFLSEKARQLKICLETWLPKPLDLSYPSIWTSQHPQFLAKQEHEHSTLNSPCFSLENSLSGHFLAEKARQLEICWETWLPKALDQTDASFWTSQNHQRSAKQHHKDCREKIPSFYLENSPTDNFLAKKARQLEISGETWLPQALNQSD